jgi:hypothetical protein
MMLVLTLACVTLALGAEGWPGLAILFAVFVAPGVVRTASLAAKRRAKGERLSLQQKMEVFGASFAIMFVASMATGVVFTITCVSAAAFGALGGDTGMVMGSVVGVVLGLIAAVTVASAILRAMWADFGMPPATAGTVAPPSSDSQPQADDSQDP